MNPSSAKLSRRILFAGAGAVGAAATVASLVPTVKPAVPVAQEPKSTPAKGGGYALTEHVKRYYKTTLV